MLGAPFCMFIKAWEFSLFFWGTPKHAFRSSSRHRLFLASGPRFFVRCPFCHCPFQSLLMHLGWESTNKRSNAKNGNCQQTTHWWSIHDYHVLWSIVAECSEYCLFLETMMNNYYSIQNTWSYSLFWWLPICWGGVWCACPGIRIYQKFEPQKKGLVDFFKKEWTTECARFMFCLWWIWNINMF